MAGRSVAWSGTVKVSPLGGAADAYERETTWLITVAGDCALPIQKSHQSKVMLGRDVDEAAAGVSACGMGQLECAVDHAFGFKLTLDLDPVPDQEGGIGGNLEALRGEIHEGAETGRSVAAHEALPVDGDAKVAAWIGHAVPFVIEQQV
jgi:hypothetical protein